MLPSLLLMPANVPPTRVIAAFLLLLQMLLQQHVVNAAELGNSDAVAANERGEEGKEGEQQQQEQPQQQNVSDFDVIDLNADGLISYGEFQRWHHAAMRAKSKASAALFGTFDLDRDGKLTVAEFVPLAFELTTQSRKPMELVELEKATFEKLDTNSDGLLTVEELMNGGGGGANDGGGEQHAPPVSREIVHGLFQLADGNGDARISAEEFGRVAKTMESHISQEAKDLGQAQSLMAALDQNGDGQIRAEELALYGRRYGEKEEDRQLTAKVAIQQLDRDGNGAISLDELKRLPEAVMNAAGIRPISGA